MGYGIVTKPSGDFCACCGEPVLGKTNFCPNCGGPLTLEGSDKKEKEVLALRKDFAVEVATRAKTERLTQIIKSIIEEGEE